MERGRVPPETLTGVVPMMHYFHSDALNVSLGAFGTLTKYLNPVIFPIRIRTSCPVPEAYGLFP